MSNKITAKEEEKTSCNHKMGMLTKLLLLYCVNGVRIFFSNSVQSYIWFRCVCGVDDERNNIVGECCVCNACEYVDLHLCVVPKNNFFQQYVPMKKYLYDPWRTVVAVFVYV